MKLKLFRVICWFILFANSYCQTIIDDTLTKHIDVTGDNVKDKIVLNLKAKSFNDPFVWILTIFSKGEKILSHVSDDLWMDSFFSDKGFVDDNCQNYEECKKQYYYNSILENLISGIDVGRNYNLISSTIKEELEKKTKLSDKKVNRLTEKIISRIKSKKLILVSIHESPVQAHLPIAYVKEINKFVIVYKW